MSSGDPSLSVRKSRRRVIGLDGTLELDESHRETVQLTGSAPAEEGKFPITAVDVSDGGMAVLSTCFLPKRTSCRVRLRHPLEGHPPLLDAQVRVARPQMVDRRPGYQLGLIFDDQDGSFEDRLSAFLRAIDDF